MEAPKDRLFCFELVMTKIEKKKVPACQIRNYMRSANLGTTATGGERDLITTWGEGERVDLSEAAFDL